MLVVLHKTTVSTFISTSRNFPYATLTARPSLS